jgi:hypothetical protein
MENSNLTKRDMASIHIESANRKSNRNMNDLDDNQ